MVFLFMPRMVMLMKFILDRMLMRSRLGMTVDIGVPMLMLMFVRVLVNQTPVPMTMLMPVFVPMGMFVPVLQLPYLERALIAVGKIEPIQAGQVLIVEKVFCRIIKGNMAILDYQSALGQFADEEDIVADQNQGGIDPA